MPVADDWRTCPLNLVNKAFTNRQDNWEAAITGQFKHLLDNESVRRSLPSLNLTPNHELTDGQLVRFRGMVQDMFDPEIYMAEYETRNLATGVNQVVCGRYRDVLQNTMRTEILEDSPLNVLKDRGVVYCVSIPGESPWVTDILSSRVDDKAGPSGTYQNPLKRGLEPQNDNQVESMDMDAPSAPANGDAPSLAGKRSKGEDGAPVPATNGTSKGQPDLNLPIQNPKGKAVIVKLYDIPENEIKLCDMLEFVGVVSLNPALAAAEDGEGMMGSSLPPPSLVPRLHVVHHQKLTSNNPLMETMTLSVADIERTREQLLYILTQSLLGDSLAAEYLLFHLISKVYSRHDIRILGKLSLNLFRLSSNQNWSRRIYTLLNLFTTGSHYLPLSKQQLETTPFTPVKDFEANRLVSGILQLPAGTHLVVDETVMADCQLDAKAVQNLTALGNLMTWQKVDYDFKYHNLEYQTDIPVLVMSEGRSMLTADVQVMVKPEENSPSPDTLIETNFRNIGNILNQELLNRIRVYLSQARELEYSLTDLLQKEVQEDFVRMRHENQGQISVDDLHSHLVLARLASVSRGKSTLEAGDWTRVKEMEADRRNNRMAPQRAEAVQPNGLPMHISA